MLLIIGGVFALKLIKNQKQEKESESRIEIDSEIKNGLAYIPVKINGQEFSFIVDTAANISVITPAEIKILTKNGKLKKEDFGEQKKVILATTSKSKAEHNGIMVNFKTLKIRRNVFREVQVFCTKDPDAEPLLGSDILSSFANVTIDYVNEKVIFEIKKNIE